MALISACLFGFSQTALSAAGADITVCGSGGADYTTIQSAINASHDGDTLLICDGTYRENLSVMNRNITIKSEHGADYTTIRPPSQSMSMGGGCPMHSKPNTILFQNDSIGCTLDGFTITGSSGKTAIYARSNLTVQNCVISNNNAGSSAYGGGLGSNGSVLIKIINTSFSGNQAKYGGAVYINTGATVIISGSTFTNNSASYLGGAIDFNSVTSDSTLTDSTIDSNSAAYSGGGIYINNSKINVVKCDIKNNIAKGSGTNGGGAVFINGSGGDSDFTNCLITGNKASSKGGVAYGNTSTKLSFINCTMVDNSADVQGGALYIHSYGNFDVHNSIFWGNSSPDGNNCYIRNYNDTSLTISNSIYNSVSSFTGKAPILTDNFTTNPDLTADYHLQITSTSAIDHADSAYAPSDDIDGDSRPQGTGPDIGADEYLSLGVPVDHYSISHSGHGITCAGEPVTITARDASGAVFPVAADTQITVTTTPASGSWGLTSGSGAFTNNGSGTATYTIPAGESSVVLNYANTTVGTYSFDVIDKDAKTEAPDQDPSITFSNAGLRFYADGTAAANYNKIGLNNKIQIGGKSSNRAPNGETLYLRAIQTNTNTMKCEARASGAINVDMGYECVNPGTCAGSNLVGITIGTANLSCPNGTPSNTAIAGNDSGSVNLTPVALHFDANGTAAFSMVYCDVGQIRLHASLTLAASPADNEPEVTLTGTSNTFTNVPFGYDVSALTAAGAQAPGAANANGSIFTRAGSNFMVSVRTVLWQSADDQNHDGIPDGHTDNNPANNADLSDNQAAANFGQENTPETIPLTADLISPAAGTPGVLSVSNISGFTNGSGSTQTNYSEVGIMEIKAGGAGNYIDTPDNAIGKSGYVGRFIPDHFTVTPNSPTFANSCPAGNFTYLGQPFAFTVNPVYTVTAVNTSGAVTKNYGGAATNEDFWKLTTPTITTAYYSDQVGGGIIFSATNPGSAAFSGNAGYNGTGSLTVSGAALVYNRPAVPLNPFNAKVSLTLTDVDLTDTDSVCYDPDGDGTCDPLTIADVGGTELRWGRLKLSNSFGTELDDMRMSLVAQHYTGSKFVTNISDSCSAVSVTLGSYSGNLNSGETCIQDNGSPGLSGAGCTNAGPLTEQFSKPPTLGDFNLCLKAPGNNNHGSVKLSTSCAAWLKYDWDNNSATSDTAPTGTATFGIFRGNDRIINFMEINK